MEITVVHISYACTGDENQVSLLIASAKQRFSLCESADRCADNHLYYLLPFAQFHKIQFTTFLTLHWVYCHQSLEKKQNLFLLVSVQ